MKANKVMIVLVLIVFLVTISFAGGYWIAEQHSWREIALLTIGDKVTSVDQRESPTLEPINCSIT